MSRHPISPHYGVSLASGRTTNVRGALGGTVPRLDVRLLNPASPQSFRDIWPSGPVPAEMPRTVKGHAKTYDLEPYSTAGDSILDKGRSVIDAIFRHS